MFKSGQWPLWNKAYFLGMPLLANFQSAVFSPANLFFIFFKPVLGWSWGVIGQTFFMLAAMFWYLRSKKISKISAIFGSLVFTFSGFAVVWNQYNVHGWTLGFLPLILVLIDSYFVGKDNFWLPLLSFAIAGQIFSGYLPLVIYSWLVISASLLFSKRLFGSASLKLMLFVFIGFGLAAIQLLPGVELIIHSIRKIDPVALTGGVGFFPLRNLITLAIPNFFGSPTTGNFWGIGFYDNFACWVGVVPLILAIFVLTNFKARKESLFWLGIIIFSLVLATDNFLGKILAKLLFLEGGIPARSLVLLTFSVSVLSGFGLDLLADNFHKFKKQLFWLTGLTGLLLAVLAGIILKSSADQSQINVALRNSIISGLSLVSFLGLLIFGFWIKKVKPVLVFSIIILTGFGFWYPAQKYWSFTKKDLVFPQTPVIKFLQDDNDIFRFEPDQVIPQNMWMPYGLETASGYDTLMPKLQGEMLSLIKTGAISNQISRVHLMDNYDSSLFPILNVKYVLAKRINQQGIFSPDGQVRETFKNPRFSQVFEDKTVVVYQDGKYLPRIWTINKILSVGKNDQSVKLLKTDDFDLKETAIVVQEANGLENIDLMPAEIEILDYQPNSEKFEVVASGPSFLVESASFYPGWQARLDGRGVDIFQTDYGLRGYFIPESGEHLLEIYFDPLSFKLGLIISMASLFVCLSALRLRFKSTRF